MALLSEGWVLLFRHVETPSRQSRCAIEFQPRDDVDLKAYRRLSDRQIDGFLGLINVEGDTFICCITDSRRVAMPVPGESVNKIYAVDFLCINRDTWDFVELDSNGYPILPEQETPGDYNTGNNGSNGQHLIHPCHDLRKLLSAGGFYYSSDFDLTSTLQTRGVGAHSLSLDNYKEEYMWNSFMLQEMVEFRNKLELSIKEKLDDEGFLTTAIRGFAKTFPTYAGREKVALTVISRQSWKRAGTRFNSRGVDDDANVANFVETELILYSAKVCYSYTQIRGSIPVFWEQDTALINPKVQITRSEEATHPVFVKHFERLLGNYGAINIVNLLSTTKSGEVPLSQRYKSHIKRMKKDGTPDLYLTGFDFHKETSDKGFSSATNIYNLIKESLYEFGYYSYDLEAGKQLSEQRGVFRTNCLDCLDRTNLIQQFISNFAVTIFLKDQNIHLSQDSEFFTNHNSLWADNGDQISQIYTGTNALKSSFSRKGKMSFAGALSDATKSVSRMYINNFQDKGKQVTIDTLLGRMTGQSSVLLYDPITDYVNEKMTQFKNQYSTTEPINVFAGTFNVNGVNRVDDLSKWLYPIGDKFKPNIVVLGFQEVIELTAGSIINADYTKSSFWNNEVNKCLNQHEKYVMLRAEQMSSLVLLFFVRSECVEHVKRVEGGSKKTGMGGMTGNKGGVAIRFDYGASSFCFVNVHLAAGTSNIQERNADHFSILNGIKFTRNQTIDDHETVYWMGDLNYRIALPTEDVRARVEAGEYEYLIKHDQLTNEMNSNRAFAGYSEPTLNFRPTYKYDKGSNRYDSSEKARTPSWTDRIIYKGSKIKPLAYSSSDSLTFSDHKPVYAAYKAIVEFVDEARKLKLSKDIYGQYKSLNTTHNSLIDVVAKAAPARPAPKAKEVNLLDTEEDDYKPQLPTRQSPHGYSDILTPRRNSPKSEAPTPRSSESSAPTPPAHRSSRTLSPPISSRPAQSLPPPPPAPRTASTPVSETNPILETSRSPRKPAALPPGFSDVILQPKSSTPSRSGTPSGVSTPSQKRPIPAIPQKKDGLTADKKELLAPLVPKKPQQLANVPAIPKKPVSLKAVTSGSSGGIAENNTPPPPPSRKVMSAGDKSLDMNSWEPLVPK